MTKGAMIQLTEEHTFQYAQKHTARVAARIESQRTGIHHTHYLTGTFRNLEERMCWTIVPVSVSKAALVPLSHSSQRTPAYDRREDDKQRNKS